MVFSSALFLLAFLPVVFFLHVTVRDIRIKNIILLIASLLFYSVGEPVYIFLTLISIAMNYGFGLAVTGKHGRSWLVISVCANLLMLTVFKYTDFLLGSVNALFGTSIPLPGIALPIGISFYTFQAMSYVTDTYRDPSLSQRNILKLALYISFFPQLIAGPIVQYSDIAEEIDSRHADASDISCGLRRFIVGLSKKVIIANSVGYAADVIFGINGGGWLPAWCGAIFYCMQIYYDFSGYSDMAIGLGRMFGFRFRENFDHPYSCGSLRDFWRRWHISLSSWFKNYLYIPLGGNRHGELKTERNRLIVFFLTGLWHGASLNFIIWGLMHGVASVIEDIVSKRIRIPKIASRSYAVLVVLFAFVFFRADTLSAAAEFIRSMFSAYSVSDMQIFTALLTPKFIAVFVCAAVFSFPVIKRIDFSKPVFERLSYIAASALFVICVLEIAVNGYNPFIYFRF